MLIQLSVCTNKSQPLVTDAHLKARRRRQRFGSVVTEPEILLTKPAPYLFIFPLVTVFVRSLNEIKGVSYEPKQPLEKQNVPLHRRSIVY